jgi:SanA protein
MARQGKMERMQRGSWHHMKRRVIKFLLAAQEFHNRRAIFIARHQGMDAIGFNAPEVDAYDSFKTRCREQVAKVSAVLDIYLLRRQPKFLGPKVPIGPAAQKEPI